MDLLQCNNYLPGAVCRQADMKQNPPRNQAIAWERLAEAVNENAPSRGRPVPSDGPDYFIVTVTPLAETTFNCRPLLRDVSFMTTPCSFLRCRPLTPPASATPDSILV